MIKPSQIREKEFSKSTMGGYKTADVDSFLDEVAVSYEQLYKENSELLKKLRLLVDNIEEYRRREQSGDSAATDDVLIQARAQADKIIADARQEAERIITGAQSSASEVADSAQAVDAIRALREKEEAALAAIKAESEKFRKSLLAMYTEHLSLIQSMVGDAPSKKADRGEKTHETKLDIGSIEVDEKFAIDDIDAFAEAVSDEQGRIKEAFGGFRFEMGVEPAQDVQLGFEETVSDFEEPAAEEPAPAEEQEQVHSDIIIEFPSEEPSEQEQIDVVNLDFSDFFPEEDETDDSEEENLDDLFAGFFNPTDKPE